MIVGIGSFLCAIATPDLILNIVSYAVALVGVAFATWARQHAPWILDIHAVVPGLLAALIPIEHIFPRTRRRHTGHAHVSCL